MTQEPPEQPEYPKQELLPQQVDRGPNRTPFIIGLVVVLVIALAAGGAYYLLRDDGEGSRAAYCDQLRTLTKGGDLSAAAEAVGPNLSAELQRLIDDAPDKVADDWQKLRTIAESSNDAGDIDMSSALDALEALQTIAKDARSECDLPIELPSLPNL